MNSRERVLATLNHKEPDRVPFDLGGTVVSGIQASAYRKLRAHLGLPGKALVINDMIQQLAQVDDDLNDLFGVDVRNVSPRSSATYQIQIADSADGLYSYLYDEYQIGWRMPKAGGMYYDMFAHPLTGELTEARIDAYILPNPQDPSRFSGMREAALRIVAEGRALIVGNIYAGIFEMYLWTHGFKDGYADWASEPGLARRMLCKFRDFHLGYLEKVFEVLDGIPIDVIHMADDFAGQSGMLISPRSYRKVLKPLHKEMFDYIHSKTDAKVFIHSCGSIRPVIPDLIESGVDILNPVQVNAREMDSADLKREFGRDVVFWGGGVDTQNALDEQHTPEEVRTDVRRRLNDLMPGGGFVFATVHNIQGNVPPENIMAMWETVQEYGKY
jgi:uroporphyrinogen decarboxylase